MVKKKIKYSGNLRRKRIDQLKNMKKKTEAKGDKIFNFPEICS